MEVSVALLEAQIFREILSQPNIFSFYEFDVKCTTSGWKVFPRLEKPPS